MIMYVCNFLDLHLLPASSSSGPNVYLRFGVYYHEKSRLPARMHLPFPKAGENKRDLVILYSCTY